MKTESNTESTYMFQELIVATGILLTNTKLSFIGMYLNHNLYVYNSVYVSKLKKIQRVFEKLSNIPESYDKVITIFNFLRVDKDSVAYRLCIKVHVPKWMTTI